MADIVMYSTTPCRHCVRAKRLLEQAGFAFEEINIVATPEMREVLFDKTGEMTVPQIFVRGEYIGQDDELYEMIKSGRLAEMLNRAQSVINEVEPAAPSR
ncbi:MAG TPA: glutaredoxin [Limnochordia bacterium]|nr:glutaredoxin [Limnochordia bacterium]